MIDIDFETRSKVDILECGAWRYSEDPSTEVLCMQYSINGADPVLWIPGMPSPSWTKNFEEFKKIGGHIRVHNASFEQAIWENICEKAFGWIHIPFMYWLDTMAQAAATAVPMSLEGCGAALNLAVVKDKEGKIVMQQLSRPRKPTKTNPKEWMEKGDYPDKFRILYEYCSTDVKAQTCIGNFLPQLTTTERWVWVMDRVINRRGVGVDVDLARKTIEVIQEVEKLGLQRLIAITNGEVTSYSQVAKLKEWCVSQGVEIPSVGKEEVQQALSRSDLPENVREALKIRQALGKSSVKKLARMISSASLRDNRVRNALLYHGTSTGRWAGRLIQVQNFPRGIYGLNVDEAIQDLSTMDATSLLEKYPNLLDVISSCLRGFIIPDKGKKFLSADFNAIEPRVLFYLCGQEDALEIYRNNGDIYKEMASAVFKVPVEEVTKEQRQLGKFLILGCGYGMGVEKFIGACAAQGAIVDVETATIGVKTYRSRFSKVTRMWRDVETAAMEAVIYKKETIYAAKCSFSYDEKRDFLVVTLPSNRPIYYHMPRISSKEREVFDQNTKRKKTILTNELTFMGANSTTNQYLRTGTYGGSLVENIVQAVARDCLVEGVFRLEKNKYPVIMTVHDEVVSEVPENYGSVEEYEALLSVSPSFAPDLPIKAEGWEGKRYRK